MSALTITVRTDHHPHPRRRHTHRRNRPRRRHRADPQSSGLALVTHPRILVHPALTRPQSDTAQIDRTATALRADGFDVDVTIDDTYRATAEVEADKIDRQAARVDALAVKADRRAADAETAWAADKAAHATLPPGGEPIKIGHHSESRHRRARDKSWNALGKAVMTEREATAARGRAAAHTTSARYQPQTVARRIDKLAESVNHVPVTLCHTCPETTHVRRSSTVVCHEHGTSVT